MDQSELDLSARHGSSAGRAGKELGQARTGHRSRAERTAALELGGVEGEQGRRAEERWREERGAAGNRVQQRSTAREKTGVGEQASRAPGSSEQGRRELERRAEDGRDAGGRGVGARQGSRHGDSVGSSHGSKQRELRV